MQTTEYDGRTERRVLIGMVTSAGVLGRIAPLWDAQLSEEGFRSRYANIVGGWCVDHWLRWNKPPGRDVVNCFASWAQRSRSKVDAAQIEEFLTGLSDEYEAYAEETNDEYLVDLAARHFNEVRVEKHNQAVSGDLAVGRVDEAIKRIRSFDGVRLGRGALVDVLHDREALASAFRSKKEPLITWPGAMGEFLNVEEAFERDCFVALAGTKGRGKTWWLQEFAWQAMLQRRRVLFLQCGDMSQDQQMRRFIARAVGRRFRPKPLKVPTLITPNEHGPPTVVTADLPAGEPITYPEGLAAFERIVQSRIKSERSYFRLSCHPTTSLTCHGIRDILNQEERASGWVPDVVCIDYMDILAPMDPKLPKVDQITQTWESMRALSLERHCLIIGATQANAAAMKAEVLDMTHFGGSHLKYAAANCVLCLNQTELEKEMGVYRLGWAKVREAEFSLGRTVYVAGQLGIGKPAIVSCHPLPKRRGAEEE